MSRARSSKKRNKPSGARQAARRSSPKQQQPQQQPPPLGAQILPPGPGAEAQRPRTGRPPGTATSRGRREVPRAEQVDVEEKNFYGETAVQMFGRVRRELLHIVMMAAISFAVGFLVVQFVKV